MNENASGVTCEQVASEMASVLDGSAPAALLDHVSGCDNCRDARYDAERAELLMTEAGSDFEMPQGLAKRLAATKPEPALEQAPNIEPAHSLEAADKTESAPAKTESAPVKTESA